MRKDERCGHPTMPDHAEDRYSNLGLDQLEEAQGGGQPTLTAAARQDFQFQKPCNAFSSVADPDSCVFVPPGSGSASQR